MIASRHPAVSRSMVLLLAGVGFPLLSAPRAGSQPVGEAEVVIVSADVFLRWYGHGGRTYFIQAADPNGPLLANDPLQRWVWQDVIEFGNNEEISYEVGSTAGKGFFRLHSTGQSPPPGVSLEDWDADGDGLSNALELQLQTHPLHPDTSGDGIPDGWAHAHGLNPLANNAAGFFQGGGLTNLQAFQAGVQGHPAATLANLDGDSLDNELDADPRERVIDWAPTGHPVFAVIELDVNDVEELLLDDFTESGSVLLTRIQHHAPVGRIVIDGNLVPHTFPHGATPTAGAPFVGYGPTLVGEKVAGARLVNGVVTDSLWDPLANTFATWQRPFGYDSDIRDERGGIYLGRNWLGLSPDGLRRSPDGDLLPGENLVQSWDARIEGNGNIISDQGYWRKDPVSGALGNVRRFPATPSGVRSATLVQGSPAVEWHLVASHSGLMVAKDGGAFVQASGELKEVPVHGVTRQGWVTDTHQDRIRANGQWHPMVSLVGGGDYEEADLLDIMDTGLAIAKIRRTGQPLRLAILVPVEVVPDFNRDGKIDSADRGKVTNQKPWRFWRNSDDDSGTEGGDDIPDADEPDYQGSSVDGVRDLVDFFPVHFDLKAVLGVMPETEYHYFLKHKSQSFYLGGAVPVPSFNVLWYPEAELEADPSGESGVGSYLKNLARAQDITVRTSNMIPQNGLQIPVEMLTAAKEGKGVALFESRQPTDNPIVIEIRKNNGTSVAEIEMPVMILEVESMYRSKFLNENLGGGTQGGVPAEPGNWPDADRNGKHFIFVHGYNVSGEQSRGWNSEIFKRMFWSGSNAMFTGISWHGNETQFGPLLGNFMTPDYWANVHNAFQTSKSVADFVNELPGSGKCIAAHSLGNVVVSSAIRDHGMSVANYYMVDAAAAIEAYSLHSTVGNAEMSHPDWRAYDEKLWSSEWHEIFPETDNRRKQMTWRGRFGDLPNAYNFHSTGEDILKNGTGEVPPIAALRSWVGQEMLKARLPVLSSSSGGWDFNKARKVHKVFQYDPVYVDGYVLMDPVAAAAIPLADLEEIPFFQPFANERFHDPVLGSAEAAKYDQVSKALAESLPALTFAAGSNPIQIFNTRNFDMMEMRNSWPDGRTAPTVDPDLRGWRHSDIKDMAYLYTHKVFEKFVNLGGLDQ